MEIEGELEPTPGCSSYPTNPFRDEEGAVCHETGGARNTMPGFEYQFKLIMLWICRALISGENFELSTEDVKHKVYDDFYFKNYLQKYQLFVQIKYSTVGKSITFKDLFRQEKSDFSLQKYFKSFMEMHNYSKTDQFESKFVLYTNRHFENSAETFAEFELNETVFTAMNSCDILNQKLLKFKDNFKGRKYLVDKLLEGTEFCESDVELFLKQFYFVVNAESESELENKIKITMKKLYSCGNIENQYNQYFKDFREWFRPNKGTILSYKILKDYFNSLFQGINFQVLKPNSNFYGRTNELNIMKKLVIEDDKKSAIDLVVSGLAGVGKSELLRYFAHRYLNEHFQYIIWINAESQELIKNSLNELANLLNIKSDDSFRVISQRLLQELSGKKCLFIYDNVDNSFISDSELLLQNHSLHRVIMTSQLKGWEYEELNLETFSLQDAVAFLKQEETLGNVDEILVQKLAEILSCLPLALRIVSVYYKKKSKDDQNIGKKYKIEDLLFELETENTEFVDFNPTRIQDCYKKSLTGALKMTVRRLVTENLGDDAIRILQMMSYLEADKISVDICKIISANDENLKCKIISLLTENSLIKCENGFCSVHRLVQDVIRSEVRKDNVKQSGIIMLVLHTISKSYIHYAHMNKVYKNLNENTSLKEKIFRYDMATNVLQLLLDYDRSYNDTNTLLKIFEDKYNYHVLNSSMTFPIVLCKATYQYCRLLKQVGEFSKCIVKIENVLDLDYLDSLDISIAGFNLCTQIILLLAFCYKNVKKYTECYDLYDKYLNILNTHLGSCSIFHLEIKLQKANYLIQEHFYKEALPELENSFQMLVKLLVKRARISDFHCETCLLENIYCDCGDELFGDLDNKIKYLILCIYKCKYIVEGAKNALKFLRSYKYLFNDRDFKLFVLKLIADTLGIQQNYKKQIKCYERIINIFDRDNAHNYLRSILNSNLIDKNVSFKTDSLKKLIYRYKRFIWFSKNNFRIETNSKMNKFTKGMLILKNGNLKSALNIFTELCIQIRMDSEEDLRKGFGEYRLYTPCVFEIAKIISFKGRLKDSLKKLRKYMNAFQNDNPVIKNDCLLFEIELFLMHGRYHDSIKSYMEVIERISSSPVHYKIYIRGQVLAIYYKFGYLEIAKCILHEMYIESIRSNDDKYNWSSPDILIIHIYESRDDFIQYNIQEYLLFKKYDVWSFIPLDLEYCKRSLIISQNRCYDNNINYFSNSNLLQEFDAPNNNMIDVALSLYQLKRYDECFEHLNKLILMLEYCIDKDNVYVLKKDMEMFRNLVKYKMQQK